ELAATAGGLVARFGEHALRIGRRVLDARPALAGYAGRRALLGIRPEDFEDATLVDRTPPDATLSATTEIREDMGPEVYAHFSLGVPPVRRPEVEEAKREDEAGEQPPPGSAAFVARLGRETGASEGRPIRLLVNTDRLYFFDRESGLSIDGSG